MFNVKTPSGFELSRPAQLPRQAPPQVGSSDGAVGHR